MIHAHRRSRVGSMRSGRGCETGPDDDPLTSLSSASCIRKRTVSAASGHPDPDLDLAPLRGQCGDRVAIVNADPRVSTHAGQPVFAGGEPLDVPEARELLSGIKRQKGQRTRPGQGFP